MPESDINIKCMSEIYSVRGENSKAEKGDGKCWSGRWRVFTSKEASLRMCCLNKDLKEGLP